MPVYRSRTEVTAVHWYENVDWPAVVGYYRTPPHVPGFQYDEPETPGDQVHDKCGKTWHVHGWIDQPPKGLAVCPGMWVVQMPSKRFFVLSDEHMRQQFELPQESNG